MTGGEIFHDGVGLREPNRKHLAWFPDEVWLRPGLSVNGLSQEEPFVGRCGEVGDDLGSAAVSARQVRDLMKLCLLMNRVYPPYSKWLGTAFTALPCAWALTPHLSGALSARSWQEREQAPFSARACARSVTGVAQRGQQVGVRTPKYRLAGVFSRKSRRTFRSSTRAWWAPLCRSWAAVWPGR